MYEASEMTEDSKVVALGGCGSSGAGENGYCGEDGGNVSIGLSGETGSTDVCMGALRSGERLSLRVDEARSGMRLDAVLEALFPGMGVRGRRRLVERGSVLLNGRRAKPGQAVQAGDLVEATGEPSNQSVQMEQSNGIPQANLLGVRGDFCFFAKPAMLHTVRVDGSSEPSLEDQVPSILDAYRSTAVEASAQYVYPPVQLLQRLDFETSGIVTGALSAEAVAIFKALEQEGLLRKRYVCLVEGNLQDEVIVSSRLVSDGSGGVRVVNEDDPDPVRTTRLYPLCRLEPSEISVSVQGVDALTLAGVVIRRGARHQIRAHVASLGHPLVGDSLYGAKGHLVSEDGENSPRFLLHHGRLAFGGVCMELEPVWALPSKARKAVHRWFAHEGKIR